MLLPATVVYYCVVVAACDSDVSLSLVAYRTGSLRTRGKPRSIYSDFTERGNMRTLISRPCGFCRLARRESIIHAVLILYVSFELYYKISSF